MNFKLFIENKSPISTLKIYNSDDDYILSLIGYINYVFHNSFLKIYIDKELLYTYPIEEIIEVNTRSTAGFYEEQLFNMIKDIF